jgi:hypothetical protein
VRKVAVLRRVQQGRVVLHRVHQEVRVPSGALLALRVLSKLFNVSCRLNMLDTRSFCSPHLSIRDTGCTRSLRLTYLFLVRSIAPSLLSPPPPPPPYSLSFTS